LLNCLEIYIPTSIIIILSPSLSLYVSCVG
jgi:hypothetical protein